MHADPQRIRLACEELTFEGEGAKKGRRKATPTHYFISVRLDD